MQKINTAGRHPESPNARVCVTGPARIRLGAASALDEDDLIEVLWCLERVYSNKTQEISQFGLSEMFDLTDTFLNLRKPFLISLDTRTLSRQSLPSSPPPPLRCRPVYGFTASRAKHVYSNLRIHGRHPVARSLAQAERKAARWSASSLLWFSGWRSLCALQWQCLARFVRFSSKRPHNQIRSDQR